MSEIRVPPPARRPGYRADIEGLRGVAVLLVLLFHYGVARLSGGFVGVDVFFVISGYLITGLLRQELARGPLDLAAFYERRIRRIVPALAVMLIATGIASLFTMLPEDLRGQAKSTLAAAVFVSNALFAKVAADYFTAGSLALDPLLHTWSLGVEAQFYLVFPILMLLGGRASPRRLAALLGPLALLSFGLALRGVARDPISTFYLLPGRAWELLAGGLLTVVPTIRPRLAGLSAAVGLVLILSAAVAFDPATPFPGAAALLPVAGALLVILGRGSAVAAVLGTPSLAALGRISYSLYLWHWPVLVLARYAWGGEPSAPARMVLALLSVGLAALTYALVERPIITRRFLRGRRALVGAALVVTAAALGTGETLDLAGRGLLPVATLPPAVEALAEGSFDRLEGECPVPAGPPRPYPCRFGAAEVEPSVLLWGNSYARMWIPALGPAARAQGLGGLAFIFSKCPPLLGFDPSDLPGCAAFNRAAIGYVENHREIRTVILGADWFTAGPALDGLEGTLAALKAAGVSIAVVLAPPQADYVVPRTLALAALHGAPPPPPIDEAAARARQSASTSLITRLAARFGARIIDPATRLCSGGVCPVVQDGRPTFYDAGHLTVSAAAREAALFEPTLAAVHEAAPR